MAQGFGVAGFWNYCRFGNENLLKLKPIGSYSGSGTLGQHSGFPLQGVELWVNLPPAQGYLTRASYYD